MLEFASFIISLFVSVFFLLLCTGKKKKKDNVSTISFHQRNAINGSADIEAANNTSGGEDVPPSHPHKASLSIKSEDKHLSTATQNSQNRELPYIPNGNEEHRTYSHRSSLDSSEHLDASTKEQSRPQSPKGRRLPAPPPEDAMKVTTEIQSYNEDEDPYASVDDDDKEEERKPDAVRLKVKTLDIHEGSGDSSFYAKVTDNVEEDSDLYAQVDDKKLEEDKTESKPTTSGQSSSVSSSTDAYQVPEYASIDKVNRTVSVKKTSRESTSGGPVAPPIPERNFGSDDEDASSVNKEESEEEEAEEEKVPTYDKLCVRESLEHQRKREEVEKERRERYENLPCINSVENPSDVYAQIDENQSEAVYESLSQLGSADGTFQPNNSNPDYSSIRDLTDGGENRPNPPVGADLQARPQRQHHYEQIEQRPET